MEIVRLPEGQSAPTDADCISLNEMPDGRCRLEASALMNCDDNEEAESVALVDGGAYPSLAQAEAAGIAWAESRCVERLFISRNT